MAAYFQERCAFSLSSLLSFLPSFLPSPFLPSLLPRRPDPGRLRQDGQARRCITDPYELPASAEKGVSTSSSSVMPRRNWRVCPSRERGQVQRPGSRSRSSYPAVHERLRQEEGGAGRNERLCEGLTLVAVYRRLLFLGEVLAQGSQTPRRRCGLVNRRVDDAVDADPVSAGHLQPSWRQRKGKSSRPVLADAAREYVAEGVL